MAGIKKTTDLGTKGVRNIADDAVMPATITIGNVSHTELGYLDGVTSAIQTQLNTKLSTAVTSLTGTANQVTVSASTGAVTVSLPSAITLNRSSATGWNAGSCFNLQIDGTTYSTIGVNGNYRVQLSGGLDVYGSLTLNSNSTGYYQATTSTWSGNPSNGVGKLEYHSNRWYLGSGPDSAEIVRIRRGGTDEVIISNDGTVYAYAYRGNENVGGTGEASWHPAGIYSNGQNWLYGAVHLNGNNINNGGTIYMNNWFRSSGGSGWYNETYTGGIYMEDSTWIRTYNYKNFYCSAEIRSNNPFSSNGPNNGIYVRLNSSNQGSFSWVSPNFWFIVDGSLVKTFVIDHPTKQDNWLVHACAEGPTSDVFYRGEAALENGIAVVTLPDYFEELTELAGRTIQITPIADDTGNAANLAVYPITNGKFMVEQTGGYINKKQRFYWRVDAVRKNTEFEVEPLRSTVDVHGTGPYTYLTKKA